MLGRNLNRLRRCGIRWLTTLEKESVRGRIYEDTEHPIRPLDIRPSAWSVIWKLKRHGRSYFVKIQPLKDVSGHEAFFVGGTVRDLCLNLPPKDIDIVTSAELHEVLIK